MEVEKLIHVPTLGTHTHVKPLPAAALSAVCKLSRALTATLTWATLAVLPFCRQENGSAER